MSNPESVDTTEADLEEVLKGLKQEQLDKLTKELSKKKTPADMTHKWNEAKEKIMRSNRIKGLADRLYLENRKAPYNFDTHQEFNDYDAMCRKRATDEAIRRIVAEDMERTDGKR